MRAHVLRCMVAVLVTLVVLTLPRCVMAAEMIVHAVSRHGQSDDGTVYNNENPGLGFVTNDGYLGGLYYNSYKRWSPYAGREALYMDTIGVWGGVAFNYFAVSKTGILVVGGFVAKVHLDKESALRIYGVPKIGPNPGVVHLAFSHSF